MANATLRGHLERVVWTHAFNGTQMVIVADTETEARFHVLGNLPPGSFLGDVLELTGMWREDIYLGKRFEIQGGFIAVVVQWNEQAERDNELYDDPPVGSWPDREN